MSKLHSSREIEAVLIKLGFLKVSQKGSHAKFKDQDGTTVILPMSKKEIPEGTFRSILKQADTSLKKFNSLV